MSTRVPQSYCLACDTPLDGATDFAHNVPREGDYSVCIECGNVAIYRADQTLRAMTPGDWSAIRPDERDALERTQELIERKLSRAR